MLKPFQVRLSKPQSTSSQGSFLGECFSEIVFFCHFFRTMIETFAVFVGQNSIGLSICFLRVNKRVWKRRKSDVERKNFEFGRKNSAGFVKTSLHRFMRTVWVGEYSETISIFKFNCTLSGKILAFVKIDLTELWRLPFICPWKNLRTKISVETFSRHWIKSLQFSVKNYGPGLSKLQYTCP